MGTFDFEHGNRNARFRKKIAMKAPRALTREGNLSPDTEECLYHISNQTLTESPGTDLSGPWGLGGKNRVVNPLSDTGSS